MQNEKIGGGEQTFAAAAICYSVALILSQALL